MKEPIVFKADVPLDSNTNRSELLWIIAPEILGLYVPLQGKISLHSSPFLQGVDQRPDLGDNQACILYLYIVIFFIYFILQAI